MSLKPGNYSAADGTKIQILGKIPDPNDTKYEWVGCYLNNDKMWICSNWTSTGLSGYHISLNIVLPPTYKYRNVYVNGGFYSEWSSKIVKNGDAKLGVLRAQFDERGLIPSTVEFVRIDDVPKEWLANE